ncbi:MAG: 50S ribosomal protein L19 [Candidatus Moranbacteria bacterium]|nr:50S ribosomal protein L19 [Candidatus Moranbacteria bacterium]
MHKKLIEFNLNQRRTDLPELQSGDVVKVYRKIKEGAKERTQMFEGMVIAIKGRQSSSPTITVRKVSMGIGVELVLPLNSPQVEKIDLIKSTRARRAKLYFVRDKSAKLLSKKLKEVPMKKTVVKAVATEVAKEAPAVEAVAEAPTEAAVE